MRTASQHREMLMVERLLSVNFALFFAKIKEKPSSLVNRAELSAFAFYVVGNRVGRRFFSYIMPTYPRK